MGTFRSVNIADKGQVDLETFSIRFVFLDKNFISKQNAKCFICRYSGTLGFLKKELRVNKVSEMF